MNKLFLLLGLGVLFCFSFVNGLTVDLTGGGADLVVDDVSGDVSVVDHVVFADDLVIGVNVDDNYFVLKKFDDGFFFSFDKDVVVDFVVTTTWDDINTFVVNYDSMGYIERVGFFVNRFNVPLRYVDDVLFGMVGN